MVAYILSNTDLAIKDVLDFEEFEFREDIEFGNKSSIVVIRKPNIENDDFVICKDGNTTRFVGLCETYESSEGSAYTITMVQKDRFFDRQIFVGQESLISSTGIEDFIVSEINANWKNSGDTLLDKPYIVARALTHTQINAKASTIGSVEKGIYNLKTFCGNAKEYYHVKIDFSVGVDDILVTDSGNFFVTDTGYNFSVYYSDVAHGHMFISVSVDDSAVAPIDVTVAEVAGYSETYDVDVLSKLCVKWLNTTTSETSYLTYYLKTNRTITTNASDPDRAAGIVKSIYVEAESQDVMYQSVVQEFSSNSYQHKISFSLKKNSRAYPHDQFYCGRSAMIKTKTGIKNTIVTGTVETSSEGFIGLVFGKLKVTLLEKIRSK